MKAVALREQRGIMVNAGCVRMPLERSGIDWIEWCAKWDVRPQDVPGTCTHMIEIIGNPVMFFNEADVAASPVAPDEYAEAG